MTVAAANTPLLVKNTTESTQTVLLMPTDNAADNVTVASEFVGTLEDTQIAASTDDLANYAFNGLKFVMVRSALDIAASRAWLSIPTSTSRSITLVFDDLTEVKEVKGVKEVTEGDWYDLSGRKLDKMPTKRSAEGRLYPQGLKKGVYILNGKKVVIK